MRVLAMMAVPVALLAVPAGAQVRPAAPAPVDQGDDPLPLPQQQPPRPIDTNQAGRTADSSVGQVGQRQTRENTAAETGIKPMARIANRIQNRVQNRIRNRIDRNYDPQAGATDPFAVAEDQARAGTRPR